MASGYDKRVALFGGSFNPPHVGHTAICKWLLGQEIYDEVWVVPCFIHPLGKNLVPFEHRLEMCRLAFGKMTLPIKVIEIERELGGESRTVRTIEHLMKRNPNCLFHFVIGSDIEKEEKLWHRYESIKKLVKIVQIPRGEDSPIPNVSSTDVRYRIGNNLPYRDLLEPEVAIYIITKAIYHDEDSTKE